MISLYLWAGMVSRGSIPLTKTKPKTLLVSMARKEVIKGPRNTQE